MKHFFSHPIRRFGYTKTSRQNLLCDTNRLPYRL